VRASWLEDLVWSDVRCFLVDPGEVLERVREQLGSEDNATELEARRDELAKRLASRQAERRIATSGPTHRDTSPRRSST
jgi:hypothetical protein